MHPDVIAIWAKTKGQGWGVGGAFMFFGHMSSFNKNCRYFSYFFMKTNVGEFIYKCLAEGLLMLKSIFWEIKKNIVNLSSAELAQRVVKVKATGIQVCLCPNCLYRGYSRLLYSTLDIKKIKVVI